MFTAILLGCLGLTAIIGAIGLASDSSGSSMAGYNQGSSNTSSFASDLISTMTASVTAASDEASKEKANITPNGETIIGLRSPTLHSNGSEISGAIDYSMTTTTFDTTTYGDRAILKLTNTTNYSMALQGVSIRGKIVSQLSGKNGYVWEYSDYDSIDKEGEKYTEVSNDFIFSPSQAKNIGDFVWKELKPHELYSLMLVGMHYNYEIGDVYHLTLVHTMNNGTMENIDTDVEVMGTSMSRNVGGVGTTNLSLRVPSSAWELTLARNARLVGAGNSQRLNNRSNVVTVASSTWTGQADYFCDGTDDDVEIQAAIDYVSSIGGGSIILTGGDYNIAKTIILKNNIYLSGCGTSSVLKWDGTTPIGFISSSVTAKISDITINGEDKNGSSNYGILHANNSLNELVITNVKVLNIKSSSGFSYGIAAIGSIVFKSMVDRCFVSNITASGLNNAVGIMGMGLCTNNIVNDISSTGGGYGFADCKKCQQNIASSCTSGSYFNSFSDSGTSNACADTADGGYNS